MKCSRSLKRIQTSRLLSGISTSTDEALLIRRQFLTALGGTLTAGVARAKPDLVAEWRGIAKSTDGTVGAAALNLESGELTAFNGDERFPLASVCKLPVAMHTLALVDEGKMALDQQIEVLARDVFSGVSDLGFDSGRSTA